MPWPVTINGITFTRDMFSGYAYVESFPILVQAMADAGALVDQRYGDVILAAAQAAALLQSMNTQRMLAAPVNAAIPLTFAAHHQKLIQATGAATLSAAWGDVGGGFYCIVSNLRNVALPITVSGMSLVHPEGHTKVQVNGMAVLVTTYGAPGVMQLSGQTEA